jgi:SAM-dependent methyltransferase
MSRFEPAPFRALYEQQLSSILKDYKPLIVLDKRNEFYLKMLSDHDALERGKKLVDLGAGLSVFGPVCKAYGMDVTLIDDFGGGGGVDLDRPETSMPLLDVFERRFGLSIVRSNFLEEPLPLPTSSVDAITCFHSLEHWHHSPKRLFKEIVRILKPGGLLVIATPNAVNLRKRTFVLLGKSNLPTLKDWYDEGDPVFRGHVREPIIADLKGLIERNGMKVEGVYGRNFIGQRSKVLAGVPAPILGFVARASQAVLRFFPSLCSDIHVVGRKPAR